MDGMNKMELVCCISSIFAPTFFSKVAFSLGVMNGSYHKLS